MHDIVDAGGFRRLGDHARAARLNGREFLRAGFSKDADKINHRRGAAQGRRNRLRTAHIGLYRHHLADAAERLKKEGKVGPPASDAHAPAVARQRPDDVAADKAGAAEHRHHPSFANGLVIVADHRDLLRLRRAGSRRKNGRYGSSEI